MIEQAAGRFTPREVVVSHGGIQSQPVGRSAAADARPPLAALWWAAKGNWDEAHKIVQDEGRRMPPGCMPICIGVEGDLGNAGYWYRQAGQPVAKDSLEAEWERIVAALLARANG